MSYTAREAKVALFRYLGISENDITFIANTSERGFVYKASNEDKAVIFIYPISHKADDSKNFFDTRDSGAYERGVAWNYSLEHQLKYFCFAVHDQVEKYKNYVFSLECDEKVVEEVSGTQNGARAGKGTQIVIPNYFKPSKAFERIQTKNGFFISVIHRDELQNYIMHYDNRPYLLDEKMVDLQHCGSAESEEDVELRYDVKLQLQKPFERNRIIFGAPGTGKSYMLNCDKDTLLCNGGDFERVTFHPDYSYANFVGTYKPVTVEGQSDMFVDPKAKEVLSILNDDSKTAQEKYDFLYDSFKDEGLTRLPVLLGLYSDEPFKTRKQDGTYTADDNSVERNHGRSIRKYVNIITGKEKSGDIAYKYVPGPFMRVYVNALKSARTENPQPYLLIIEEINRANVAAVFGDIFQLLDRDDNGVSEYPIQASEDIKKYLAQELGGEPDDYAKLRLPNNMFIWATMNSADQGVFPMDTAFKRRWDFTYLGIDDNDGDICDKFVQVGANKKQRIEWNSLRKAINEFLANEKINEDKQLGPYFMSRSIVVPADGGTEIDSEKFCNAFKNKVLMYLFEDAAKQKRPKLFEGSKYGQTRYSKICEAFDEQGIDIFNEAIRDTVKIVDADDTELELDSDGNE